MKGIFFSLDMLFAVVIAGILIASFYYHLYRSQEDAYSKLYLSKIANDALIILDKNGTLETLNPTIINESLVKILPSNIAWKLNITYYSYCLWPGSFILKYPADAVEKDYVTGRRNFITIGKLMGSNVITNCSLAELRVWLK